MTGTALEVLKDHHQQILGLFELVLQSKDLNEKLIIFQQLRDEMELHTQMEERVFFPALSHDEDIAEALDREFDSHDEMADFIEEIEQMEAESMGGSTFDSALDEFDDAFDELKTAFERHVEDEEKNLFPAADDILSDRDLRELGYELEQMRRPAQAA
jgi:iron-sulfur cluster repair protein YtfE (RIC family)